MQGLDIDIDRVRSVLLADGWHEVAMDEQNPAVSTFDLDGYTYARPTVQPEAAAVTRSHARRADLCPTAFVFRERGASGEWIAGPLTAVLAVRYTRDFTGQ